MDTSVSQRFYVYTLAYPDGTVFYVGKGKGKRIYLHEVEARAGKQSYKCNVIRKIWAQGGKIIRQKIAFFDEGSEALAFEQQLIASFGRENLTNRTDGGGGMSGYQRDIELNQVGKLLLIACQRRARRLGIHTYNWQRLSEEVGIDISNVTRIIQGTFQRPRYRTVLQLWEVLEDDDPLFQDEFFNSFGYASPRQRATVAPYVERLEQQEE